MATHTIGTRKEWLAARLELDRAPRGRNENGMWWAVTTSTIIAERNRHDGLMDGAGQFLIPPADY